MPALCSKSLDLYVYDADSTVQATFSLGDPNGVATAGIIVPAGKYRTLCRNSYPATYSLDPRFWGQDCPGANDFVASIGGGDGNCQTWPNIQVLPIGYIHGFAMISDSTANAAIAVQSATSALGSLLDFTLASATSISMVWDSSGILGVPGLCPGCNYVNDLGGNALVFDIIRIGKPCGT